MTDHDLPQPAADEEALSAYLAGEMTDAQAAAFEQRMADEPALAARLDALAAALFALGDFEHVEPPAGFDRRLDQRLADERSESVAAPVDLSAYRRRKQLWLGIGTAAAVIAVGAVMGGSVLRGVGGGGADMAAEGAAGEAGDAGTLSGQAADEGAPGAPVILDDNVALADEAALQERYGDLPEAQGLLGVDVEEARRLDTAFTRVVARRDAAVITGEVSDLQAAAPRASVGASAGGTTAEGDAAKEESLAGDSTGEESAEMEAAPPDAAAPTDAAAAPDAGAAAPPGTRRRDPCLAAIREDAKAPLVPVRVESLRYAGKPAVAYVFVTASPDASQLDRTEVWVVSPSDCATFVFQQY